MADSLRERVLATMYARLQALTDAGSVHRLAFAKIPEGDLPAIIQVDGAEVRETPAQGIRQVGAPPYLMQPGVVVVVRAEEDDAVGTLLASWVAAVKLAVATDPDTGTYEPTFGGLVEYATCTGADSPSPTSEAEAGQPQAAQLVHFELSRPEHEMNPFLQNGF